MNFSSKNVHQGKNNRNLIGWFIKIFDSYLIASAKVCLLQGEIHQLRRRVGLMSGQEHNNYLPSNRRWYQGSRLPKVTQQ